MQAYPSAFSKTGGTTLYYAVPQMANATVTLQIRDHTGSAVRTYDIGKKDPGTYAQEWDAKYDAGACVVDGLYTALLTISNETATITRSCDLVVDSVAPATGISFSKAPRPDGSYEKGVTFSLSGYDAGSGIDSYYYSINGGGWETWCSPVALNNGGQYTIKYKAIDCAGNYLIQTTTITVRATVTPTPAPTPAPTPWPVVTPAATPVPGQLTFDLNPGNVGVHDGQIVFATDDVQSTVGDRRVGGSVVVNLTHAPADASLDVYVRSSPEATQVSQFKIAVEGCGGSIQDYAGVLVIDHPTLANGADIASATVTMEVSRAWVEAHGGIDAVKILRYSDGSAEWLDTSYAGTDGDLMVFTAFSPHGLSTFALAALSAPVVADAASQPAGQPSDTGGSGIIVFIGALAIVAAVLGAIGYFATMLQEKDKRVSGK